MIFAFVVAAVPAAAAAAADDDDDDDDDVQVRGRQHCADGQGVPSPVHPA